MCNPKPLNRCSNHAKTARDKAYNDVTASYGVRGNAKNELLIAEANHREAVLVLKKHPNPENRKVVKAAVAGIANAAANVQKADKGVKAAMEDYQQKTLMFDATPAGMKQLGNGKYNDSEIHIREEVSEEMKSWNKRVRDMKDDEGIKLVSSDGKFSPQAPAMLKSLLTEAEAEEKAAEANEKNNKLKVRELKRQVAEADNEQSNIIRMNSGNPDMDLWNEANERANALMEEYKTARDNEVRFKLQRVMHTIHKNDLQEALGNAEKQ